MRPPRSSFIKREKEVLGDIMMLSLCGRYVVEGKAVKERLREREGRGENAEETTGQVCFGSKS